jgi:hypothetical protein
MTRLRRSFLAASRALPRVLALVAIAVLACSKGDLTGVGSHLRTPPDTLRTAEVTEVVQDSVFYIPISLGASPSGQIGRQGPYTSHVLYDFLVPSFIVDQGDTLLLDSADLVVKFGTNPPYTGTMLVALREVAPEARHWATDPDTTLIAVLPDLLPGSPAPPDSVTGGLSGDTKLTFPLDLHSLSGYDTAIAELDTLDVNVALTFAGFAAGGPGFIEFAYSQASGPAGGFAGRYREPGSIVVPVDSTTTPWKRKDGRLAQRTVVEFDSTYSPGTNLVVSDGYRMHTYLKMGDLSALPDSVLPDSAFVVRAELVLVQATRPDTIFGVGPQIGVIVPDSTKIYSRSENNRVPVKGTSAELAPDPEAEVVMQVTAYIFGQKESFVPNTGMLLRLSSEGTKARHFEFHGGSDPDPAKRPRLRLIYGTPPSFGGDRP